MLCNPPAHKEQRHAIARSKGLGIVLILTSFPCARRECLYLDTTSCGGSEALPLLISLYHKGRKINSHLQVSPIYRDLSLSRSLLDPVLRKRGPRSVGEGKITERGDAFELYEATQLILKVSKRSTLKGVAPSSLPTECVTPCPISTLLREISNTDIRDF